MGQNCIISVGRAIIRRITSVSWGRWMEIILTGIGLFANVITIAQALGFMNTTSVSSFSSVHQELLVWSLIALIYSLGLINALILRRWQRLFKQRNRIATRFWFMLWQYDKVVVWRLYAWHVIVSFVFTFLYTQAVMAAFSGGTFSPWTAFFISCALVWIVALVLMGVTRLFDAALSLYSGEGDLKSELTDGLM